MTDSIADIFTEVLSNPLVSTGVTLLGIALLALWLAAAWWAYQDAARRSESTLVAFLASAWIIVSTPLMLPVALAIYGFARPQITAADHRARYLARELGAVVDGPACPSCQLSIESSWLRCPACAVWLAEPCSSCGTWSASNLEACPYCGAEEHAAPVVEPDTAPALPVGAGIAVGPGIAVRPGLPSGAGAPAGSFVRARAARHRAGHGTAAAGVSPAAAVPKRAQRVPVASSARPRSYAASRDAASVSS
ncbi:MAG TPA: zinc ribbon domain-containing protein [Candidatus Limnocylindria bacterium]|nr:zinc ribbon domain-containing protein [Candidatus Limnocylindria bacterium]